MNKLILGFTGLCLLTAGVLAQAQVLTNFEGVTAPGPNGGIMFRTPQFSGTTSARVEAAGTLISEVRNVGIPAGNANVGNNALFASWNFVDSGAAPLWVRFTTDSATLPLGRPTIPLAASTGLQFDIWSDRDLFVALGIRETETGAAFGANGGATGTIEYLGGNPNSASSPRGLAVTANTWTTLTFEFLNPTATPVFAFTGNGVLDPGADGKGVLESLGLAFDDTAANRSTDVNLWLDNFAIIGVPEPSLAALSLLAGAALVLFRKRHRA